MQYSIAFLAAFSATGALAAPAIPRDNHMMPEAPQGGFADIDFSKYQCPQQPKNGEVNVMGGKKVTVTLLGESELAQQFEMISNNGKFFSCAGADYNGISVNVFDDAQLKDLRCAIADEQDKMIGASRGENVDFTFSDGGNQTAWDFLIPTNKQKTIRVAKILCDVDFKKIDANQRKVEEAVNVLLRQQKGGNPKTIGPFNGPFFGKDDVKEVRLPVDANKQYETLEVQVGRLTNPQLLRCKAIGGNNNEFFAVRGQNTDTSFSDNNAGEWSFLGRRGQPKPIRGIREIACSSAFEQNNRTPSPAQ